jgi:hypothetical protein
MGRIMAERGAEDTLYEIGGFAELRYEILRR